MIGSTCIAIDALASDSGQVAYDGLFAHKHKRERLQMHVADGAKQPDAPGEASPFV